MMYSESQKVELASFPLSEEDAFNSNPKIGALAYRLPAPHDLFGVEQRALEHIIELKFILSLMVTKDGVTHKLKCKDERLCRVTYHRYNTPKLHWLSPKVVYYTQEANLIFDPRKI